MRAVVVSLMKLNSSIDEGNMRGSEASSPIVEHDDQNWNSTVKLNTILSCTGCKAYYKRRKHKEKIIQNVDDSILKFEYIIYV